MSVITETDWMTAEQLVEHLPGPAMCSSTIRRWATVGIRGHRLPHLRRGGRRFYQVETVLRFLEEIANEGTPAA